MTSLPELREILTTEAGRLAGDAARLEARGYAVLAADLRGIAVRLAAVAARLSKLDLS